MVRALPSFADDVSAVLRERALPLVSRNLQVVAAELDDTHIATARAGIESLRAIEHVVAAATAF